MATDKQHVAAVTLALTRLCRIYDKKLTPELRDAYAIGLDGLTVEQIAEATKTALQSDSPFMPRPGQLRSIARNGGISPEAKAIAAWDELVASLESGRWETLTPLTNAICKQVGGWDRLREMPLSECDTWKRKEFISAYATIVKEEPERLEAICSGQSAIGVALATKMQEKLEATKAD